MNLDHLKADLINWVSELDDEQLLLELLHLKEGDSFLSPEHQDVLNERLEQYEAGKTEFSDWESVKSRVQSRQKDVS